MVNILLENFSAVLFCGFLALFVLPEVLIQLFYVLPGVTYYAAKGKVKWQGLLQPLGKIGLWGAVTTLTFACIYLFNSASFLLVSNSLTAIVCWSVLGLVVLVQFPLKAPRIRTGFYENVYLKNSTSETREEYNQFIQYADTLYQNEAEALLRKRNLNYLQRKALQNRVALLAAQG